jgi:membrane-associated protease RseP (regulator of RpoE activity)
MRRKACPLQTRKLQSMKMLIAAAVGLAATLAGCAQAPLGRSVEQAVRIEVPGCGALRCELRNDRGQWVVEKTPGSVLVKTSARPLEVSCQATDAPAGTARLASSQQAPSDGRAVTGAAVGAGVGAAAVAPALALGGPFGFLAATVVVIGAVSGAGLARTADAASHEFSYPPVVVVTMVCPAPAPDAQAMAGARWGLAVRGAAPGDGAPPGSVWVSAVAAGGRAEAAGLRVGDLLMALDGRALSGTLDLEDALLQAQSGAGPLTLRVRRGGVDTLLALRRASSP